MQRISKYLLVGFLIISGVGCGENLETINPPSAQQTTTPISHDWVDLGDGAQRLTDLSVSPSITIELYRFPQTNYSFRFINSTEPKTVAEWAKTLPNATLISNGVYFHEDLLPSGFFVSNGQLVGTREFDTNRSGMIVLAPEVSIFEDIGVHPTLSKTTEEAAQSYPFLIKNGSLAIVSDSNQLARRTFLGTDTQGLVYIGIVPDDAVSLYELAKRLEKIPVSWDSVINLDGGPSSGLVDHTEKPESMNSFVAVPNIVVVEPRGEN